jgi:AcrR family transcriptional regulator
MSSRFQTKQDHILKAARRIVSDGGFHDLQMLTVAAAAGVAVGSVYRYYPSKAELCAALVARVSARELEVIEALLRADSPEPARLVAAVETFARRALQSPRLAYAMIAEPVDEEVDRVRLEYRAAISHAFERVIAAGGRSGAFRPVAARTAAACIVGAFMEALVGPLAPDNPREAADKTPFVEELAGLCLAMLMARPTQTPVVRLSAKPVRAPRPQGPRP